MPLCVLKNAHILEKIFHGATIFKVPYNSTFTYTCLNASKREYDENFSRELDIPDTMFSFLNDREILTTHLIWKSRSQLPHYGPHIG